MLLFFEDFHCESRGHNYGICITTGTVQGVGMTVMSGPPRRGRPPSATGPDRMCLAGKREIVQVRDCSRATGRAVVRSAEKRVVDRGKDLSSTKLSRLGDQE